MEPNSSTQFQQAGDALLNERRFVEARATLEEGLLHFPHNYWLSRSLVMVERQSGSESSAVQAIRELHAVFPDEPQASADLANCVLNDLNDVQEAEAIVEAALVQFPDHLWLNHLRAICAARRGDYSGALGRWTRIRESHPNHTHCVFGISHALQKLGRLGEAEHVLQDATIECPDDINIAIAHARIADAREDRKESIKRWGHLRAAHPTNNEVQQGYGEAIQKVRPGGGSERSSPPIGRRLRNFGAKLYKPR